LFAFFEDPALHQATSSGARRAPLRRARLTARLASIRVGIKDATLSRKRSVVRVRLVTTVCIKRQIAGAVVQNGNSSRKG
jgi:hypothetical protein